MEFYSSNLMTSRVLLNKAELRGHEVGWDIWDVEARVRGYREANSWASKGKAQTHQALSLFPIDWSLGGGHWRAKVRGWLYERRVTEGVKMPGEVRPGVFRLRHG